MGAYVPTKTNKHKKKNKKILKGQPKFISFYNASFLNTKDVFVCVCCGLLLIYFKYINVTTYNILLYLGAFS